MSTAANGHDQAHVDIVYLYTLKALPADELAAAEAQIAGCADCRDEIDALRPVTNALVAWPTDVLRPPVALWDRVAQRIGHEGKMAPLSAGASHPARVPWEEVAPGISCKLLSVDGDSDRVSMLVRLTPGTEYPPHEHAGLEELHLLDGELWIDDRKLSPGDYNLGEPGGVDRRVWSETGCTCLLITSTRDRLL
jgi:quercetin dioxygenase-like cupin family protein